MAPEWHDQLSPDHIKFVNDLLDYWQTKSQAVKFYQCDFARYDYNTTICNWRDPHNNMLAAASTMTGEIRFAAPDQACYETVHVFDFAGPPEQPGQQPQYIKRDESNNREKWICSGTSIFEFDYQNKKMYEVAIPPEMQGRGLINSPLPFLFGASKDEILNRFWVRNITPAGAKNEYWLEAYPKTIDDARNYLKLELAISRDELFLPVMLHIFATDYNPKINNETSRIIEFKNRKVNGNLAKVQDFFQWFVRPKTPFGWEHVQRAPLQASNQIDPKTIER